MIRWWRRRRRWELACREAVALMGRYLDGELVGSERDRLEAHLSGCPHCREHLAQLRTTVTALGRYDLGELDEGAVDDLVDLYRRWQTD